MKNLSLSSVTTASAKQRLYDMWQAIQNAFIPGMGQVRAAFRELNDLMIFAGAFGFSVMMVGPLVGIPIALDGNTPSVEQMREFWTEITTLVPQLSHPVTLIIAGALYVMALREAAIFLIKGGQVTMELGMKQAFPVMVQKADEMLNRFSNFIGFLAKATFLVAAGTVLVWYIWHNMG